jgi:alpha-D-ribose 1-methylphosphonate 5-triphosphate synthase subunit PhnI
MAYVAVRGGQEAVAESINLLEESRAGASSDIKLEALEKHLSLLIDRIMGEAGFYAPRYAALALKQSEGSPEEAVFLLRAYRSTLSRSYLSLPLDCADMVILRRISAAFKDIPGGQFLGATYDYTHRLLDFGLLNGRLEEKGEPEAAASETAGLWQDSSTGTGEPIQAPRVSEKLKREGLLNTSTDAAEPWDITGHPLNFPAPRSARLQTLARADTGYICGLAYAAIRGFGAAHPTVGELRTGTMEVIISHPLLEGEKLVVGEIMVTEIESLFSEEEEKNKKEIREDPLVILNSGQGDKADTSGNSLSLGSGYGLVFGRHDTKAIAMSILDYSLSATAAKASGAASGNKEGDAASPLSNQEFVLLHGDCLEMNGFLSHLKLPHYVTFQSKLDRVRHTQKKPEGYHDGV